MTRYRLAAKKNLITIVRKLGVGEDVNEREMQVFETHLLRGYFRPRTEGRRRIVYTAPLSISLKEYIRRGITVHQFYSILAQTVESVKRVEMNGFHLYNLVLDERLIHVKETTGELFFLYEPLYSRSNCSQIYAFLGDLLERILRQEDRQESGRPEELLEECSRFGEFLEDNSHYRISDVEGFILGNYPQIYQQIVRAETGKSGYIASNPVSYRNHYHPSSGLEENAGASGGITASGEEGTTLLEEEGTALLEQEETTLLEEGTMLLCPAACILRRRTGETVTVQGDAFRIGKDINADYRIPDNNAISRKHALLVLRDKQYLLIDQNSKNHTYVNGIMLSGQEEMLLHSGDVIRMADEEFEFTVE